MLSKQTIRGSILIFMDNILINDKEVIINESKNWSEVQEMFFRKMLKQGGTFSLNEHKYRIIPPVK
tara:strand:+ start:846 stop:1043 length:198 start_codon:yes stop_codon:yes gene_type:complete